MISRFQDPGTHPGEPPGDQSDPLARVAAQIKELQTWFQYHLAARMDSVGLGVRRGLLLAGLGLVGLIALVGLVVTCVVLSLQGIAGGLALLFGDHAWAADLLTGLVPLLLLAAGMYLFYARWTKASRQRTIEKYEGQQDQQRRQFGHDVTQRAHQAPRA